MVAVAFKTAKMPHSAQITSANIIVSVRAPAPRCHAFLFYASHTLQARKHLAIRTIAKKLVIVSVTVTMNHVLMIGHPSNKSQHKHNLKKKRQHNFECQQNDHEWISINNPETALRGKFLDTC